MADHDRILSVAEIQAAEQALFNAGLPEYDLMVRAGEAAAQWIWRATAGGPVTVLCGPGNNGGDGYVIARWLKQRGADVAVIAPFEPRTHSAKQARADYEGAVLGWDNTRSGGTFIDCLFGSGQNRALDDVLSKHLEKQRRQHSRAIAVDLPTGVSSDEGTLLNPVRPYDITLALGAYKWAHWSMPSAAIMGARHLIDIGIDTMDGSASLLTKPVLSPPPADAHKYTRGLVAIVAGEMAGASALAARAAQHGGAGYVKLLCDGPAPTLPDSIVVDDRPLTDALTDKRIAAIVIGPGLGRGDHAAARLRTVLDADNSAALVIDADALHLLGKATDLANHRRIVLTPHEGELAALIKRFGAEKASEGCTPTKLRKAQHIAGMTGAVVIAKGADTMVVSAHTALIARPATTWLSTAGTGDVLAGLVASRLAVGAETMDAAAQAVWLHSEAARLSGPVFSADGLVERLPDAYASAR